MTDNVESGTGGVYWKSFLVPESDLCGRKQRSTGLWEGGVVWFVADRFNFSVNECTTMFWFRLLLRCTIHGDF